jgi:hypothetical protein
MRVGMARNSSVMKRIGQEWKDNQGRWSGLRTHGAGHLDPVGFVAGLDGVNLAVSTKQEP